MVVVVARLQHSPFCIQPEISHPPPNPGKASSITFAYQIKCAITANVSAVVIKMVIMMTMRIEDFSHWRVFTGANFHVCLFRFITTLIEL